MELGEDIFIIYGHHGFVLSLAFVNIAYLPTYYYLANHKIKYLPNLLYQTT